MKFHKTLYRIQLIAVFASIIIGIIVYLIGDGYMTGVTSVYLFGILLQLILAGIDWLDRKTFSLFQMLLLAISISMFLLLVLGIRSSYDNTEHEAYIKMVYTVMLGSYVYTLVPIYDLISRTKDTNTKQE